MPNPKLNDLRIGHLSYNGFEFPALADIKASLRPEKNKAENGIKWIALQLDVKFIYYPTAENLPVSVAETISEGKNYDNTADLPDYMDRMATDLRRRLLQPGQAFSMYDMGLGQLSINQTSVANDLNNGPFPTECTWAPIAGNIIAEFTWSCTVYFNPRCSNTYIDGITDLSYMVTWEQDEENSFQFIRTIQGSIEFLNNRLPNSGSINAGLSLGSLNNKINGVVYPILKQMFPKPAGYKRTKTLSLAENNKVLSFSFVDAEIMKDVAPPRPILDMSIRQTIASTLSDGFRIWKSSFSGEIKVAKARQNAATSFSSQKKLAWVAIGQLISKRLDLAKQHTWNNASGGRTKCKIFVDSISITDEVNEAGFSFNISYRLVAGKKIVIAASGMFSTLGLPGETWERRQQYLNQIGTENEPILPWPVDRPQIVDACSNPNQIGEQTTNVNSVESASSYSEVPAKGQEVEDSYIKYENSYIVEELNMSSVHVPLNNTESRKEVIRNQHPTGIVPVSDNSYAGSAPLPIVNNPTARTFIVTMYGSALRAGNPTTPPNLVSYGGKPCVKIGVDSINMRERVIGVALDPNETSTTLYQTSWRKQYLVHGNLSPNEVAGRYTDRVSDAPFLTNSQAIA